MEKYLGNKASLLRSIEAYLAKKVPAANSLADPFAGTTNVPRYFRARGWRTIACDANRFSYVLAHAYLRTTDAPSFDGLGSIRASQAALEQFELDVARTLSRYGALYLPEVSAAAYLKEFSRFASVLGKLQEIGELNTKPWIITEYYTRWGSKSRYESLRGTKGYRNYFSRSNALVLDGILRKLRQWWQEGRLSHAELFLLLTSVIEEVVITANVNGTFHDFNRVKLWPNAQQTFRLRLPIISCTKDASEIANADASSASASLAHHDVCYLDPPYNFRQYSAYYHLLNLIPAIPLLRDLDAYMEGVSHVRGQNPEDNFTSDFCFKDRFIESMRRLIESTNASHVLLSYYSGRNHWNHWSNVEIPTDEGKLALANLFQDRRLFDEFEVVSVLDVRLNYQSRGGEQKGLIDEHLFYGRRKSRVTHPIASEAYPLESNVRWNLGDDFRHLRHASVKGFNDLIQVAA